mmetsp:Transcript_5664/g.9318  ORF Transcript_5664/g.9318 Transcript_5664/m.9318 type:complete len:301 (+) Transcript_5664:892-1794(+)
MCVVTVKDHLVNVHWIISNQLVHATRQCLSPDHPLRRLLRCHTHQSSRVNWASKQTLLPIGALAYRFFAIDEKSWNTVLSDSFKLYQYETFGSFLESKQLPEEVMKALPMYQDGMGLWDVIKQYVTSYLTIFFPDDASVQNDVELKTYWAQFEPRPMWIDCALPPLSRESLIEQVTHSIFWVTGGHELVGQIVEFFKDPSGVVGKIRPGKEEADVESFFLSLLLIALTGFHQPMLMSDWTHLHKYEGLAEDKQNRVFASLEGFQSNLKELVTRIDKDNNTTRPYKFMALNPRTLECSVSL